MRIKKMRVRRIVIGIVTVLVCIVIAASALFVSGQQGLAWFSVQHQSGGKFVAVQDKEAISRLKDAVKEAMHNGPKVDAADYETTYGSSLFLVNWICPVQIKGAYPKRVAGQSNDEQKDDDGQRSDRLHNDSGDEGDGYLIQVGFETYWISEKQYDILLAPYITALSEAEY